MKRFTLRRELKEPKTFNYTLIPMGKVPIGMTYYLTNPLTTDVVPYKKQARIDVHYYVDSEGAIAGVPNVYVDGNLLAAYFKLLE